MWDPTTRWFASVDKAMNLRIPYKEFLDQLDNYQLLTMEFTGWLVVATNYDVIM
jgi:hypothetical protein